MELSGKKIVNLVHRDFEDLELWYPVYRLREAGATVHIAGGRQAERYVGKHGVPAAADVSFDDVIADHYDALLVPGGWAPDRLRRFESVLKLVRHFHENEKPIGQICHAGWVLASACILKGYTVTSTPGIKDDLINAGANWVDESAVTDRHIVSAQRPPDLPNYLLQLIQVIQQYSREKTTS
jgi:protease I